MRITDDPRDAQEPVGSAPPQLGLDQQLGQGYSFEVVPSVPGKYAGRQIIRLL